MSFNYSGYKPPPPPPHKNNGKGACSLTLFLVPFVLVGVLAKALWRVVTPDIRPTAEPEEPTTDLWCFWCDAHKTLPAPPSPAEVSRLLDAHERARHPHTLKRTGT